MCITIDKAELSKTKILSIPVGNGNHFIAYSNSVRNTSGKANAMILAIPGKTKQAWFYDTTKYKTFLDDIINNSDYKKNYLGMVSRSKSLSKGFLGDIDEFKVGIYNVGLSDSFDAVLQFINKNVVNKPNIQSSLSEFFKTHYRGWSFAACLFDTNKTIDAQPIAFEYTPFEADSIYFPTMDAHTGSAPSFEGVVDVDHTFIYEHTGKPEVKLYREFVELNNEGLPVFLNKRKYRHIIISSAKEMNGDTFMNTAEITSTPFQDNPSMYRG